MVAALFRLGVVTGVAIVAGLSRYMSWARSKFSARQAGILRLAFSASRAGAPWAGHRRVSRGPDLVAFISGAAAGYLGTALWGFLLWVRRRRR